MTAPLASNAPRADLARAAAALKAGEAAVFPTDTVYGLGVSPRHASSPQILFDIKQRAADKPVAWLVGSPEDLDVYGADVPERARELARAHWPGALTIIVKASDAVPKAFRAQGGTIGLRMPASHAALELIGLVGGPLATTSANISGQPAPHSLDDVDPRILDRAAAVRSDEPSSGVASTVIDCSQGNVEVIRRGSVC